jgi:hypothetical protein
MELEDLWRRALNIVYSLFEQVGRALESFKHRFSVTFEGTKIMPGTKEVPQNGESTVGLEARTAGWMNKTFTPSWPIEILGILRRGVEDGAIVATPMPINPEPHTPYRAGIWPSTAAHIKTWTEATRVIESLSLVEYRNCVKWHITACTWLSSGQALVRKSSQVSDILLDKSRQISAKRRSYGRNDR